MQLATFSHFYNDTATWWLTSLENVKSTKINVFLSIVPNCLFASSATISNKDCLGIIRANWLLAASLGQWQQHQPSLGQSLSPLTSLFFFSSSMFRSSKSKTLKMWLELLKMLFAHSCGLVPHFLVHASQCTRSMFGLLLLLMAEETFSLEQSVSQF